MGIQTIALQVLDQSAEIVSAPPIVAGTTGVYRVEFSFSPLWEDWEKTAVFTNGVTAGECAIEEDGCTVPGALLLPGRALRIGVYGVQGESFLPTLWAAPLEIQAGAYPVEAEPVPPLTADKIMEAMGDLLTLETEDKSSLVAAINALYGIVEGDLPTATAGAHNAIYRGKYLGDSLTDTQAAAIAVGTFEGLYIGDYWTIGGVNYRIAAFDYYLNSGSTSCTSHHIVLVPDTVLYTHAMNSTNTTAGGYVGSEMYTEGLEDAKTIIKAAFPGHVLSHKVFLTNAVTDGHPSAVAWYDSEVDLMNEQMVYGGAIFMPIGDGSVICSSRRVEKSQLPLFRHDHSRIIPSRSYFWLQDVLSSTCFSLAGGEGVANVATASYVSGVRPAFCIY